MLTKLGTKFLEGKQRKKSSDERGGLERGQRLQSTVGGFGLLTEKKYSDWKPTPFQGQWGADSRKFSIALGPLQSLMVMFQPPWQTRDRGNQLSRIEEKGKIGSYWEFGESGVGKGPLKKRADSVAPP